MTTLPPDYEQAQKQQDEQAKADPGAFWTVDEVQNLTFKPGPPYPPPRPLVYGTIACRGRVTLFGGTSGVSKSAIVATTTLDMASGGSITNTSCPEGDLRVVAISAEDDQDEIDRTMHAACEANNLSTTKIESRVLPIGRDKMKGQTVAIVGDARTPQINLPFFKMLQSLVSAHNADVLILDPLAGLTGAVEFTPGVMNLLLRELIDMAIRMNIAVIVVVHTRKKQALNAKGDDAEDISGGKTQQNAARSVNMIRTMTDAEAEKFTIEKRKAKSYVKQTVAKTNMGADGVNRWWERDTVWLKHDDGAYEMNCVRPWIPPHVSKIADLRIWAKTKSALEEQFVYASDKSRSEPKLRQVIQDAADAEGVNVDAREVAKAMIDNGWIAVTDDYNEKRNKVQRAVVGPHDPDVVTDDGAYVGDDFEDEEIPF